MTKTTAKTRFKMVKEHHKKTFLTALTANKVDPQAISLCRFFAGTKNYFTSSSCSGRIVLLKVNKEESKQDSAFIGKWHRTVKQNELMEVLEKATQEETWFKQESFILHIGCRDLQSAKKLLQIAKDCGIKRAGINVPKEGKFILELIGTQNIAFPAKKQAQPIVSEQAIKYILERANTKLEKNYAQLEKFEQECRKKLD